MNLPAAETDGDFAKTVRQLLRTVFRHRRKILLIFFSVLAVTVVAIIVWPRSYPSSAKLFVRIGRESIALDPTATMGQTIALQKFQEEEINSVLGIFNSRETMIQVVDQVGADNILAGTTGDGGGGAVAEPNAIMAAASTAKDWLDEALLAVGVKDPLSDREAAIRKLEDSLFASAPKRSMVVSVECTAKTPELAQKLVETATATFLQQHVQLSRTAGSHQFFVEQAEMLHQQMTDAFATLRDRKNTYGMVDVESQRAILRDEMSSVEMEVLNSARDVKFSEARLAELTQNRDRLPEKIVGNDVAVPNSARDGMRQQLYELQMREQELLAKRTANHPTVVKIQEQRHQIEKIMEEQPPERTQLTYVPNPIRQEMDGEILREQANLDALLTRQHVLTKQQAELREKLEQLNNQQVELAELERQAIVLEKKYLAHVEKLEQARIDEALELEQISSINVVQPATLVEKPSSPNKRLLLAAGMLLAIVTSLGTAFGVETLDPTLRTADQVEERLKLPVVASLPAWQAARSETGHSVKLRRAKAGALAVAGLENGGLPEQNGEGASEYRALAGRLRWVDHAASQQQEPTAVTVAVVNCSSQRRDQSVAAALAINAIELVDKPVLLVDADVGLRRAGDRFGANGAPGLCDVLRGRTDVKACVVESGIENLALLAAGTTDGQQPSFIDLRRLERELQPLLPDYGLVIVDVSAPTAGGAEMSAVAGFDAVVMVVEAERTRTDMAQRIKRQLTAAGANVLGVVLDDQREYVPNWLRNIV